MTAAAAAKPAEQGGLDQRIAQETTLLALTRLMSRWSSLDFQRRIVSDSNVPLDPAAVRALYLLGIQRGTATPSELADEMHLTRPSTSKIIARMAEAGLVIRTPAPNDHRSTLIELTDTGRTTFTQLFSAGVAMMADASSGWEPAEFAQLATLLTRFVDDLVPGEHPE